MTPNNSSICSVRMATAPFDANHDTSMFVARGWRCFISRSTGGVNWILKRGASVAMFAQGLTNSITQTVQLPAGPDSSELCDLLMNSGIGVPA